MKNGPRVVYVNIPQVIAVGHVVTIEFRGWRGKAGLDWEGHRRFRQREAGICPIQDLSTDVKGMLMESI